MWHGFLVDKLWEDEKILGNESRFTMGYNEPFTIYLLGRDIYIDGKHRLKHNIQRLSC